MANMCFALSGSDLAFSAGDDRSFLWHVLWVSAHHVCIYRDRVVTRVCGLVLSQGLESLFNPACFSKRLQTFRFPPSVKPENLVQV